MLLRLWCATQINIFTANLRSFLICSSVRIQPTGAKPTKDWALPYEVTTFWPPSPVITLDTDDFSLELHKTPVARVRIEDRMKSRGPTVPGGQHDEEVGLACCAVHFFASPARLR